MSVMGSNGSEAAYLDSMRLTKGPEELKDYFYKLATGNKKKALEQINDENLQYATLYLLNPLLSKTGLLNHLDSRNLGAVRLENAIRSKNTPCVEYLVKNYNDSVHEILKWMLLSGSSDDGLENRYDEILELAAGLLVRYYNDTSILPVVTELIFRRNRKRFLIHNLIWVFFDARNPESLILLANYLYSQDSRDYELACKLLGFIPCIQQNNYAGNAKMYYEASQWIQENSMFLYRTEECLHLTANPISYALSVESKYLCKPVSPVDGKPFRDFSDDEEILLSRFRTLDKGICLQLADFSYLLYRRNMHQWNEWIHFPVQDQLRTMRMTMGGRL